MGDFGDIALALLAVAAPLLLAGWLLGRKARGGPPDRAARDARPRRDNMAP
ncbi:MAG: hypothetical protein JNN03_22855 [Rubrivivax sp.]|nr:hypothetical protein [Rubrivivax sp.]